MTSPSRTTVLFRGAISALVTPFSREKLDLDTLQRLVERQVAGGVDGLAPCTLAGEVSTLSRSERAGVIRATVETADGRVPVLAGAGASGTDASIALVADAQAAGADAVLVAVPFYNKPSQLGIVNHFEQIARAVDIPLLIHHVPAHQGLDLTPSTIRALAAIPSVVGVADMSGDLGRLALYRSVETPFFVLGGSDQAIVPFCMAGGDGTLSGLANVEPALVASLTHAALAGYLPAASQIERRLRPLLEALLSGHDSAALKQALSLLMGLDPALRLPMVPVEPPVAEAIGEALLRLHSATLASPYENLMPVGTFPHRNPMRRPLA